MTDLRWQPTERDLAEGLADLTRWIDYPPAPDVSTAVRRRIAAEQERGRTAARGRAPGVDQTQTARSGRIHRPLPPHRLRRRPAWLLVSTALAILAFAVLLISPTARSTLADRLGLWRARAG